MENVKACQLFLWQFECVIRIWNNPIISQMCCRTNQLNLDAVVPPVCCWQGPSVRPTGSWCAAVPAGCLELRCGHLRGVRPKSGWCARCLPRTSTTRGGTRQTSAAESVRKTKQSNQDQNQIKPKSESKQWRRRFKIYEGKRSRRTTVREQSSQWLKYNFWGPTNYGKYGALEPPCWPHRIVWTP